MVFFVFPARLLGYSLAWIIPLPGLRVGCPNDSTRCHLVLRTRRLPGKVAAAAPGSLRLGGVRQDKDSKRQEAALTGSELLFFYLCLCIKELLTDTTGLLLMLLLLLLRSALSSVLFCYFCSKVSIKNNFDRRRENAKAASHHWPPGSEAESETSDSFFDLFRSNESALCSQYLERGEKQRHVQCEELKVIALH